QKVEKAFGKAVVNRALDKSFSMQTIAIVIEVNSIKGDGSSMNNKAYKAMKADQFPNITFVITDPVASIPYGKMEFSTTARGQLTIAGRTNKITIPIKVTSGDDKKILVSGSHQIKMTDYGISPPTAMLGVLKTGDAVTIHFETTFQ
ncbi:MAG: YceI family protein, partial [Ferruginibacter sp.]